MRIPIEADTLNQTVTYRHADGEVTLTLKWADGVWLLDIRWVLGDGSVIVRNGRVVVVNVPLVLDVDAPSNIYCRAVAVDDVEPGQNAWGSTHLLEHG